MVTNNMKEVALYIRVSTEEQAKTGLSIMAQEEKLLGFCKLKGWEVYKIYKDEGISGGSLKKRVAFNNMIKDGEMGFFSAMIVTKIDRAFRNVVDALLILENLKKHEIDFVSIGEDIDTTTPIGKAMFTIVSVFAQLEREMNIARVREVRQMKFNNGIIVSRSPLGYKPIYKDKKIVGFKIDKKKAEMIKSVFELTAEGNKYKMICDKWKIKPQTYYNIIKNKVYIGIVEFEEYEREGIHKSIIDPELFYKVNPTSPTTSQSPV